MTYPALPPTAFEPPPTGPPVDPAAAELRRISDELTEIMDRLRTYDRPDVWRGRLAAQFRIELVDQHRRLFGANGAVVALHEAAARLDVAARWRALAGPPTDQPPWA
jgi:hypothetical protein